MATTFKKLVSKRENLETLGGMSDASSEGTTHSVRMEEQLAFSDWINTNLANDPDLKHVLPIDPEGKNLYEKVKDGILLWFVLALSFSSSVVCLFFLFALDPVPDGTGTEVRPFRRTALDPSDLVAGYRLIAMASIENQ